MTLFALLALALGAAALALLAWRRAPDMASTSAAHAPDAQARPSRGLVLGMAVLMLVVAAGGYAVVGSPKLLPVNPDAPPGPGPAADAQLDVLQERAEHNPDDLSAWVLAGRVQTELGHASAAAADYRHALSLRPKDPDLLADLADMLAAQAEGRLDGEPIELVRRALAIDPDHVKALALEGGYAMTQRDFRTALDDWNHALRVAQPGDPVASFLRERLEELRERAARAAGSAAAASAASAAAS